MNTQVFAIGALLIATTAVAHAQDAPLPSNDFEDGQGAWTTYGDNVQAFVEADPKSVHGGKNSLGLSYNVGGQGIGALILPTPPGTLRDMKSLRFFLKADAPTTFVVALQEQNGGRYIATFFAPADWQEVALSPSDFSLSDEPNDPKDANARLDMDQVEGVGIADLAQIFVAGDARMAEMLFGLKPGAHSFYIDDFALDTKPLAPTEADVLDDFSRPQLGWMRLKGVTLRTTDDGVLKGAALQAEYNSEQGAIIGFAKLLASGKLQNATGLSLRVAATQATTLLVQIEEKSGGKYNATFPVPAGIAPQDVTLNFADFKPGDDSRDNNGQLDPETAKQLLFLDASAMLGQATGEQMLWLNELKATK